MSNPASAPWIAARRSGPIATPIISRLVGQCSGALQTRSLVSPLINRPRASNTQLAFRTHEEGPEGRQLDFLAARHSVADLVYDCVNEFR